MRNEDTVGFAEIIRVEEPGAKQCAMSLIRDLEMNFTTLTNKPKLSAVTIHGGDTSTVPNFYSVILHRRDDEYTATAITMMKVRAEAFLAGYQAGYKDKADPEPKIVVEALEYDLTGGQFQDQYAAYLADDPKVRECGTTEDEAYGALLRRLNRRKRTK